MNLFFVIANKQTPELQAAVARTFPDNHISIGPGQYVVAGKATTTEVAEKLGVKGGTFGRVIVAPISNYTGWHSRDVWEWMGKKQAEADASGG